MRSRCRILAVVFVLFALACPGFALDPSDLLKVLDLDIKNIRSVSGDFNHVKGPLGEAEQI